MGGGSNERKSKRGSEAVGMTGEAGGWAERNRLHQRQKLKSIQDAYWCLAKRGQWEERKKTLLSRRRGKKWEEGGLEERS